MQVAIEMHGEVAEMPFSIEKLIVDMNDRVVVNIFLTEQCNFTCKHCFYAAGPHLPKGYISNETMGKIERFIDILLDDLKVPSVRVNLIGGEPTLNLKEFKRCFDISMEWCRARRERIDWEMTTNGWWLSEMKNTLAFLEIIKGYIPTGGAERDDGGDFQIRISDTAWHREWRKGQLKGKYVSPFVEELFSETNQDFWVAESECDECGHTIAWYCDGDDCPSCGVEGSMHCTKEERLIELPAIDPNMPWIYADKWDDARHVIPSNEERSYWGGNDLASNGEGCGTHSIVTFKPNGKHIDGCCKGSNLPFGSVDDHPLVLMGLNSTFLTEEKPSCRECHMQAKRWRKEDRFTEVRAYYQGVVDTLETGEFEDKDGEWFTGLSWIEDGERVYLELEENY